MSTIAIVQARMASTRFPGKVMQPILGVPNIALLLERLARAKRIDQIIVATTVDPRDQPLADYVTGLGYEVYRGSEADVLDRYYQAAKRHRPTAVVRITADCPLIDPAVVDCVIEKFEREQADFAGNGRPPTYPDGLDVAVVTFKALEQAWHEATSAYDHEHVTPYISESGKFKVVNLANHEDVSAERWTVDEPEDLEVVKNVYEHFQPRRDFGWLEVLKLRRARPELFAMNQHLVRDEGSRIGTGQKLWKRAKRVIPGGNMFLSKRADMYLPDQWPSYFSKAKGCRVWDLDGNEFIDMAMMGIGTNTLGYGDPEVDAAVRATIEAGNLTSLNCPEEVYLAERLIELHPWANMVRFARTGGEADAIAVRIARAAAGKDVVAMCGYHGWHDWYLAANLGDNEKLVGHLLPGLEPNGVPQHLRGSVRPFNYNDFAALERLVKGGAGDVGVIVMEVMRNDEPKNDFLQKVRKLATDNGIVLIFDECTSGFRQTYGGLHLQYGVEPDMATFGKALGNGYAITATIGRREIMEAAQSTFISSTFWSERIGPAAGLKTLEVMQREKSWERITATGKGIAKGWRELADRHGLKIKITGLPALLTFTFDYPDALLYKTLVTQEMLAKGYLAGTGLYACTAHTPDVVAKYFEALDPVFATIKRCVDGFDGRSLLKGPIASAGFKRLN